MKAIALLEVQAMVAAIAGLDAMVKAADVKLIHVEKRLGGRMVTIVVEGEVSERIILRILIQLFVEQLLKLVYLLNKGLEETMELFLI